MKGRENGEGKMKKRPLAPSGGNDDVQTPLDLSFAIVEHFRPHGRILEPCRGMGSFVRWMPACDWCEITMGRDFLGEEWTANRRYDWIVTNPPWSQFRPFLLQSMKLADNVVFLSLINAWFMKARQNDLRQYGFGLVEILQIPQPPKPWPQTGFALGAGWLRRGWTGSTHFSGEALKS